MSSSKRIAAVLRVREIQERSARGALAVRRGHLRVAVIAEERTWQQLDAATTVTDPVPAASLMGRRAVVEAGVLAAERQHTTTEQAEGAVTVAMDAWTIAARRVEGMQRLTDRMSVHEAEERQRLAANEIDDLVLARFGRELGALA